MSLHEHRHRLLDRLDRLDAHWRELMQLRRDKLISFAQYLRMAEGTKAMIAKSQGVLDRLNKTIEPA